ncbi:HPP family protein [Coraliomargarita sp. W4R53]
MIQHAHTANSFKSTDSISPALHGRESVVAELLSVCFMAVIAAMSVISGCELIFFPELAALSYDVFQRPKGTWAMAPWLLALTPVATAIVGVLVATFLPFGFTSVLLAIAASILIVHLMRSPIAPAISAGLLPVVLHVDSWLYPPCILLGTVLLVIVLKLWQRYAVPRLPMLTPSVQEQADERVEWLPRRRTWMPVLLVFVVAMITLAQWTGLRLILFPPLIVIAYEMFGHPSVCPWAKKPIRMPLACCLAAAGGIFLVLTFGPGVLSTMLSMVWGILILRVFKLHVPPALAISLIPQIMENPNYWYPLSVAIGTVSLVFVFMVYKKMLSSR